MFCWKLEIVLFIRFDMLFHHRFGFTIDVTMANLSENSSTISRVAEVNRGLYLNASQRVQNISKKPGNNS